MVRPTSTAAASMTTANTADEIRGVMDALKLDVVARYFDQDDDEIDPMSFVREFPLVLSISMLETVKDYGIHFDFSPFMMGVS